MRGGARKGSGRKAGPGGRKITAGVCLTPAVWAFLRRQGQTASVAIEEMARESSKFRQWKQNREGQVEE